MQQIDQFDVVPRTRAQGDPADQLPPAVGEGREVEPVVLKHLLRLRADGGGERFGQPVHRQRRVEDPLGEPPAVAARGGRRDQQAVRLEVAQRPDLLPVGGE
ncbi:hypothetical protein ACFQV2_14820 [Actinokineospora soli]|uniref:Uncharacterized protein n=1 Tax=Actinokineospora soli TaxID=1048753 RepID=A0ABW2TLK2_9PSEU